MQDENLSPEMKYLSGMKRIEDRIGYSFADKTLLLTALTHSTFSYENKDRFSDNNERLEFLGDSVLDLIVGDILYNSEEFLPEGIMSKVRALVVCEATLSDAAKMIGLGDCLLLGKGEELTDGRSKLSNLSNALEAVIAAIYLDSGYKEAYRTVKTLLDPYIERAMKGKIVYDYKSRFLEYIQSVREQGNIKFCIVREEGPEHNRKFFAQILYKDKIVGSGSGSTKKEAEQEASKEAFEKLSPE